MKRFAILFAILVLASFAFAQQVTYVYKCTLRQPSECMQTATPRYCYNLMTNNFATMDSPSPAI